MDIEQTLIKQIGKVNQNRRVDAAFSQSLNNLVQIQIGPIFSLWLDADMASVIDVEKFLAPGVDAIKRRRLLRRPVITDQSQHRRQRWNNRLIAGHDKLLLD